MTPMDPLLGVSPAITAVREQAQQLIAREQSAQRLPPILLQGETGTGKGLLAGLIHRGGPRGSRPFVDVNCAAIPDSLLEAELFGFERGAFTDARQSKPGLIQAAQHGTIFLDEVGLLPQTLQAKLLKVIEERTVRRVGSIRSEMVDFQIIAASNEDLAVAANTGHFRRDLYHRLAVVTLTLPPLRERQQDVLLLAEHFLSRSCAEYHLHPARRLADDAKSALQRYPWPGNVRELSNVIESAVLLGEQPTVTAAMLRLTEKLHPELVCSGVEEDAVCLEERLGHLEREQLLRALQETNWNISLAAIRLGMSRNRIRYRIEKHALRATRDSSRPSRVHDARIERPHPDSGGGSSGSPRWEGRHLALLRAELAPPATAGPPLDPGRALSTIADKIASFGGHISELTATTIVGAFGLETNENAPASAAFAALAIRNAAERARRVGSRVLEVKIAVHATHAMVSATNGASRIQPESEQPARAILGALTSTAEANSIVVSAAAAPFLERRFELLRTEAIESASGPVYRIARLEGTGFGLGGRALAQFVGRQRELSIVGDQLAQAKRGRGQIVAVVGEPGVGKSRLTYELTRSEEVRGWRILSCSAVSYGMTTPSLPVVELLKRYLQIDDADSPSQIRDKITQKIPAGESRLEALLPPLLALLDIPPEDPVWHALEPAQRRQRTIDAVKHLVLQASIAQPVLIIFEDLHWIDTETQGLLDSLVDSLPAMRILLLVTYRPEYHHRWSTNSYYTQIRINPLSDDSAQALLQLLMGKHPSILPLERLLVERTEGNPLFLEESVRALTETGVLEGSRGAYRLKAPAATLEIPPTIEALLAARIDTLSQDDKRLLQAAAVVGRDIPYPLLQAIAGLAPEALHEGLAHLQSAEFIFEFALFPDLAYTFKHALTHQVAYDSVTPAQRRSLHRTIMDAIERICAGHYAEQVERLGHHAFHAEAWDKAVAYLRQSAEKAFYRSAHREAAASLEQALEALSHCSEAPDLIEQSIDLRFELRSALHPQGKFDRVLEVLEEAQRLAEQSSDERRLGRVLGYLALTVAFTGAQERALAVGHRGLEIAERLDDRALTVANNCVLGMIYQSLGRYRMSMVFNDSTIACLQGALTHERCGMPVFPALYSRHVAMLALAHLGEFDTATLYADEALQIADAVGHPLSELYTHMAAGFLSVYRGDFARAIEVLEHAMTLCETTGARLIFGWVASYLGFAYAHSGRIADGISLLEQGVDALTGLGVMLRRSLVIGWLGEAYLFAERVDDAADCAAQALDLARAQKERGDEAEALRLAGDVTLCHARPEIEKAADAYRLALVIGEELEMRPLLARCHLGLGTMHMRSNDQVRARDHLSTASEMFAAIGMQYWQEKAICEIGRLRV